MRVQNPVLGLWAIKRKPQDVPNSITGAVDEPWLSLRPWTWQGNQGPKVWGTCPVLGINPRQSSMGSLMVTSLWLKPVL